MFRRRHLPVNAATLLPVAFAFLATVPAQALPRQGVGTISVEPVDPEAGAGVSGLFVDATSNTLGEKGFTILDDSEHSAYVAEIAVSRTEVGTAPAKIRAGKAAMAGAGVIVPFSSGQYKLVPLVRTLLEIGIRRRGEQGVVWHGAAVTVRSAASQTGTSDGLASALTAAALRSFPRTSAEIASVP